MYQITLQVVGDGRGDASVFTVNKSELNATGQIPFTNYSVLVVVVNGIRPSPPSVLRTIMTVEGSEPTILLTLNDYY